MESKNDIASFRDRFEGVVSKFNRFFYSDFYFLLLLIVSFTCWATDNSVVGMYLLTLIGVISIVSNRDITPSLFLIPLMLITTSSSDFLVVQSNFNSLVVAAVMFSLAFIFNVIMYRQTYRRGRLTLPLALVCVALFMAGLNAPFIDKYFDHMLFVISLGPLMFTLYIIAMSCIHLPKDVDAKLYFAKIITFFAVIIALQVLVVRLRIEGSFVDNLRNPLDVGWSNRNGLGTILILGLGLAFYYADNTKRFNFIYYNLAMAIYLAVLVTCSRGAMIFGTLEIVAIDIYLFIKGKHRTMCLITILLWLIAFAISVAVRYDDFLLIVEEFKKVGMGSSGREQLFREAWQLFKQYPLLGTGFGYVGTVESFNAFCIYWYHNTVLQILASMGILGAIFYGIYYIARIKMWFSHINTFTLMAFFAVVAFEGQAMLDVGTFSPIPYLYLVVLLEIFVEVSGKVDDKSKMDKLVNSVHIEGREFNEKYEFNTNIS